MSVDMAVSRNRILSEFVDEYPKSNSTAKRYRNDIKEWLDYCERPGHLDFDRNKYDRDPQPFYQAGAGNLRRYLKDLLRDGYAPSTVEVRLAAISQFYQTMADIHTDSAIPTTFDIETVKNPAEGVGDITAWGEYMNRETEKERESATKADEYYYLKPNEVRKLIDHVPSPKPRNELIIRLLFQTGARRAELANVKLGDIDSEKNTVELVDTKNGGTREVPYPRTLQTDIDRWVNVHREAGSIVNSDYLFPTPRSESIHARQINEIVKKAAENAGIQSCTESKADGRKQAEVTAHTLRHSYAMDRLDNGMDTSTIQEFLGHENLETTQVYLEMSNEDAIDRYRSHTTTDV